VSTSNENIFTLPNNPMSLKASAAFKQDDIGNSQSCRIYGLNVQNFTVVNRREHALSPGLKANAKTVREEPAGELAENARRSEFLALSH
ncbi:MAG TPA: hypothetical protein VIL63_08260, partial [Terriglobales bacterium]